MDKSQILLNRPTLERLLIYYHFIVNHLEKAVCGTISSAEIAKLSNIDDTLVRKDFAAIGVKGRPRVGFAVSQVIDAIRHALGFDITSPAVVIGAGRLGGAIAAYRGFVEQGLNIVALFDINPEKIGLIIADHVVQPLEQLDMIIKQHQVKLAIVTVPARAAQNIADRLIKAGIKAIWNFSPTSLNVPRDIIVRDERLAVGLAELSYYLKQEHSQSRALDN